MEGTYCVSRPKPKPTEEGARPSHKGYELRITVKCSPDLDLLERALDRLGVGYGNAYTKRRTWVLPVYGLHEVKRVFTLTGRELE